MTTQRAIILEHYPQRILDNIEKFCKHCEFRHQSDNLGGYLNCTLLPITLEGKDCPHYKFCSDPFKRDPFAS